MSDLTNADITIGGRLAACCVPSFLKMLRDEGIALDYNEIPGSLEELRDAIDGTAAVYAKHGLHPAPPSFGSNEVEGGELNIAEAWCQQRGLPYRQHWDATASSDWNAGNRYWFPGDAKPEDVPSTNDGSDVVYLHTLRNEWADKTVAEVLAHHDAVARRVPLLEIVEPPDGGACLGCLAEALEPGSSLPQDYPPPGSSEAA